MNEIFDFSGRDSCEVAIRKTWSEFRQKLSIKEFSYSEVDAALQTVFLRTFDDLFQSTHQYFDKVAEEQRLKSGRLIHIQS